MAKKPEPATVVAAEPIVGRNVPRHTVDTTPPEAEPPVPRDVLRKTVSTGSPLSTPAPATAGAAEPIQE